MTDVPPGLAEWAARPGPAKLLDAVRVRARRGQRTEIGALSALRLSHEERREIGRVLGTRWEVSGRPPRLQDLASRLAEHGLTVRGFVELLDGGPIEPDSERRRAWANAVEDERRRIRAVLTECGLDEDHVAAWLAEQPVRGTGEIGALAEQVAAVWQTLPSPPRVTRLAQLAATVTGDAHALDADQQLGRTVARLGAVVHGLERPGRAGAAWRTAWSALGVHCDGVSSRVLVLNLPLDGSAPAARLCTAAHGEPLWLTLRSLSGAPDVRPGPVYVCENPTVLEAAADALGARCPAMVCTDGMPSGAALDLLSTLAAAGCALNYRADIDQAGFVIADQVRALAPNAVPWRFDVATYRAALGLGRDERDGSESLREAYERHGVSVHEEALLDDLLADLHADHS